MMKSLFCLFATTFVGMNGIAQEKLVKLQENRSLQLHHGSAPQGLLRTATNVLPFFDDFSYPGPFPDPSLWTDSEVYINPAAGWLPPTIGVATFDGLNGQGQPYLSGGFGHADSLTSRPLDLSGLNPSDSVYLSFFYQPQGLGFPPGTSDSLLLFFLNSSGEWVEQWALAGPDTLYSFSQVMIPVTDTQFFHASFQFRFVNDANFLDADNWDIDYVRMNSGRSYSDTVLNDVAFASPGSGMLRNYTEMPWRQFAANESGELATTLTVSLNNGWDSPQTIPISLSAVELYSGTPLTSASQVVSLSPLQQRDTVSFPMFPFNYAPANPGDSLDIAISYDLTTGPSDPKRNDTLVVQQRFGNVFAYDDGSAELGYELIGSGAELAYDFTLDKPDTLRALEINYVQSQGQFSGDLFSILVWKGIGLSGSGSPDTLVGEQDFLQPGFVDSINGFWTYVLDTPVVLPAGKFYVGTYQVYENGVDIGFDVNDHSSSHLHYKIPSSSQWWSSTYDGALMMRPVFGRNTITTVDTIPVTQIINFEIYPNPCIHQLFVRMGSYQGTVYAITDIAGRMMMEGACSREPINVSILSGGLYLITVFDQNREIVQSAKFIKQ
jgi:hypothetical protein